MQQGWELDRTKSSRRTIAKHHVSWPTLRSSCSFPQSCCMSSWITNCQNMLPKGAFEILLPDICHQFGSNTFLLFFLNLNKKHMLPSIENSPLGNHHGNNCFRQKSSMDDKTNWWKFNEERDSYTVSKYQCLPIRQSLISKGTPAREPSRHSLTKEFQRTAPVNSTTMGPLIWCTEKDTTSLLWHSCPECTAGTYHEKTEVNLK